MPYQEWAQRADKPGGLMATSDRGWCDACGQPLRPGRFGDWCPDCDRGPA